MFLVIILIAIMGLLGTDLFAPSLPEIAAHFHQAPNHTQLTISLFLAGFSFSQLFYGSVQIFISMLVNLLLNMVIHQDQSLMGLFYLALGVIGFILLMKGEK